MAVMARWWPGGSPPASHFSLPLSHAGRRERNRPRGGTGLLDTCDARRHIRYRNCPSICTCDLCHNTARTAGGYAVLPARPDTSFHGSGSLPGLRRPAGSNRAAAACSGAEVAVLAQPPRVGVGDVHAQRAQPTHHVLQAPPRPGYRPISSPPSCDTPPGAMASWCSTPPGRGRPHRLVVLDQRRAADLHVAGVGPAPLGPQRDVVVRQRHQPVHVLGALGQHLAPGWPRSPAGRAEAAALVGTGVGVHHRPQAVAARVEAGTGREARRPARGRRRRRSADGGSPVGHRLGGLHRGVVAGQRRPQAGPPSGRHQAHRGLGDHPGGPVGVEEGPGGLARHRPARGGPTQPTTSRPARSRPTGSRARSTRCRRPRRRGTRPARSSPWRGTSPAPGRCPGRGLQPGEGGPGLGPQPAVAHVEHAAAGLAGQRRCRRPAARPGRSCRSPGPAASPARPGRGPPPAPGPRPRWSPADATTSANVAGSRSLSTGESHA